MSDHVDGELRGLRRLRVLRHLDRCERCRPLLRSLERAVEQLRLLRGHDLLPPNPSAADAVIERVRLEAGAP